MAKGRLHLIPLIVFIWFPTTFLITYFIAVQLEDVPVVFPYISDTGTISPESCIFGQLLNMGSLLMAYGIYLKHCQVNELLKRYSIEGSIEKVNNNCLKLGLIASFGVSIVGNFQETNVFAIHIIGAFCAFGLGNVYMVLNTFIYIKLLPYHGTNRMKNILIILCIMNTICSNICFVTAVISFFRFTGEDMTKWKKEDGGYIHHSISAITEWISSFCTMGYILTYYEDFKTLRIEEPNVYIIDNIVLPHSTQISISGSNHI